MTAAADPNIAQIHNRMPVILERSAYDAWLDLDVPAEDAREALKSNLGGALTYYRVGRQVNKSTYDAPDCVKPVA